MIEELVTRCLILVLGYAYPAFQCFKTVEKNRVENDELRFWCQYWITVAVITVLEIIGDALISWLPLYGEMKLALFIYLWYPKSKGTGRVYDAVLRPCVLKHETNIDRSLIEFRERAWNLAVYYWQNCTELGSTKILEFLHFLSSQSSNLIGFSKDEDEKSLTVDWTPRTPSPNRSSGGLFKRFRGDKRQQQRGSYSAVRRDLATKSEAIKAQHQIQTQFVRPEDILVESEQKSGGDHDDVHAVKLRIWRFINGK